MIYKLYLGCFFRVVYIVFFLSNCIFDIKINELFVNYFFYIRYNYLRLGKESIYYL